MSRAASGALYATRRTTTIAASCPVSLSGSRIARASARGERAAGVRHTATASEAIARTAHSQPDLFAGARQIVVVNTQVAIANP